MKNFFNEITKINLDKPKIEFFPKVDIFNIIYLNSYHNHDLFDPKMIKAIFFYLAIFDYKEKLIFKRLKNTEN